jgi:hypothetical protein
MANRKIPNRPTETEPPKTLKRADEIASSGFALVVDGIFKSEFESRTSAQKLADELLKKYPMLRVEIYDALTKERMLVDKAQ